MYYKTLEYGPDQSTRRRSKMTHNCDFDLFLKKAARIFGRYTPALNFQMVIFMAKKNFFDHGSNLHFRTPIVIADHIPEYKKIRSGAKKVRAKRKKMFFFYFPKMTQKNWSKKKIKTKT